MQQSYKGSCLCGGIQFEVDRFGSQIAHCHCSMCRKFHGAAQATFAGVARKHFRWLQGEDQLKNYTAANGTVRSFCRTCGASLVFFTPKAPNDVIEIALGAFSDDVPVKPDAHIFVGSKANWIEICDDLPQYTEGRDSEQLNT